MKSLPYNRIIISIGFCLLVSCKSNEPETQNCQIKRWNNKNVLNELREYITDKPGYLKIEFISFLSKMAISDDIAIRSLIKCLDEKDISSERKFK